MRPVIAVLVAMALLAPGAGRADPAIATTFVLLCAGCHRADGHGLPSHGIPDLALSGQLAASPEGRRFLIEVPGVSQSRLDNGAVAEMLNWLLLRFAAGTLPREFRKFTVDEVAAARGDPVHDPVGRRAAIMAHLPAAAIGAVPY